MTSQSAFNRIMRVTAYRQRDNVAGIPSAYFEELGNGVEILGGRDGLRMAFQVKKGSGSDPNTCELVINNLSDESRGDIVRRPMRVRIEAGYAPPGEVAIYRLLFVGDVKKGSASTYERPDWETKLLLGDGARAIGNTRINQSWSPGTELRTILQEAAASLGVVLPPEVANLPELRAKTHTGEAALGWAADEFTRLLATYGYEWSIQNGRIQVLPFNRARPDSFVLSEENGMLGWPEVGVPDDKGKTPTTKVRCSLYPELTPGGRVELESRLTRANGRYRIESVTHSGDTRGGEWTTEVELKSL